MPARQRRPPKLRSTETASGPPKLLNKKAKHESTSKCSCCCLTVTVLLCLIQTVGVILFLTPSPISAVNFRMPAAPAISNTQSIDSEHAQRLLENQIVGPESMVSHSDYLYVSTYNRGVLRIDKHTLEIQELPPLGTPPCGTMQLEPTCGRPLGIRVFKNFLYVLDAYLGMFKYDMKDLSKPAIEVFSNVTFGNDFVIDDEGIIYFSDSSSQWDRRNFPSYLLENSLNGMLVQYNESNKQRTVLSDSLSFANGVELSHSGDFVIVSETNRARLARYWLRGPKKGFWDYINHNLPGMPDNIRRSTRGTYWIGIAAVRPFLYVDMLGEWPMLRNQIAKINWIFPQLRDYMMKKHGMIVEIDDDGRILRIFEDKTGSIFPSCSEVEETADGVLYIGSYSLPYLTKFTPPQFH